MNSEVFYPILALIFFVLGWALSELIKIIKSKYQKAVEKVNFVLELVENFVKSNPDFFEKSWRDFYKKVQSYIEKNLKVDLTDEQWAEIEKKLLELYNKFKEQIKE